MQTNLHRVSEFAVMAEHASKNDKDESESRASMKRLRDYESDTESDIDENAVGTSIIKRLPEVKNEETISSDPWVEPPKSALAERDSVILSFDWENEGPYEKAVERYVLTLFQHFHNSRSLF